MPRAVEDHPGLQTYFQIGKYSQRLDHLARRMLRVLLGVSGSYVAPIVLLESFSSHAYLGRLVEMHRLDELKTDCEMLRFVCGGAPIQHTLEMRSRKIQPQLFPSIIYQYFLVA